MRVVLFVVLILVASGCDRKDRGVDRSSPTGPSGFAQLVVSPQKIVHKIGVKQCFTATGGDGTYRWVLDNGTGPLEAGNEARACYIATFPIKYTMTVSSGNQSARAQGEVIR